MSVMTDLLNELQSKLDLHIPDRLVTREYLEFNARPQHELDQGVITIVHRKGSRDDDYLNKANILIVGQIEVNHSCSSVEVEDIELDMLEQIERFCDATSCPRLTISNYSTSGQLTAPLGWVSVNIDMGPLDLQNLDETNLDDFITFHADYQPPGVEPVLVQDTVTLEQN